MKSCLILWLSIAITISLINKSNQSQIEELSLETYQTFTSLNKLIMIFIYRNDHCKKCEEHFEIFKNFVGTYNIKIGKQNPMAFGRADVEKFHEMHRELQIKELPAVLFYNNERKLYTFYEYKKFNVGSLLNFAKVNSKQLSKEINLSDLQDGNINLSSGKTQESRIFIFVGNPIEHEEEFNTFVNSASNLKLKNIFHSKDPEMHKFFAISKFEFDVVVYKIDYKELKDFELMKLVKDDFTNNYKFENLISTFLNNPLEEYEAKHETKILEGVPTLIFVHNYKKTQLEPYLESLTTLAKENRRELNFLHADMQSSFVKSFGVSFKLSTDQTPVLCITSVSSDLNQEVLDKYRIAFKNKNPIYHELWKFINEWKEHKIERYHVSEDEPENPYDEFGVKKLTRFSFQRLVDWGEEIKDIVIFICGKNSICKESKQRYLRAVQKLKKNNIEFTEINPELNEIDLTITHVPFIAIMPLHTNTLDLKLVFKDDVTTANIVKFIEKHSYTLSKDNEIELENQAHIYNQESEDVVKMIHVDHLEDDDYDDEDYHDHEHADDDHEHDHHKNEL